MNYKFLSLLAFAICMHTSAKADTVVAIPEPSKIAAPVLKLGYVDIRGHIFENLPEYKKNITDMQSFQKQLENQLRTKYAELQEQFEAFQKDRNTLSPPVQKQKEAELHKLEATCQELQAQLHLKLENKAQEVMQPMLDRIHEAIRLIAEEGGYAFVFSKQLQTGEQLLLFADQAFDLSKLVLEKLKAMAPAAVKPPVIGQKNSAAAKATPKPTPGKKK